MIVPFLPLVVEANNALDVLLKGLDTVVAQAVAEAGDKAGHGTRSTRMQSVHRVNISALCQSEVPMCRCKQAVNSVNNAKAIRYKHTSAPNNALVFICFHAAV